MPGSIKISRFILLNLLWLTSFSACQREAFEDINGTGAVGETIMNPALIRLNPDVYTNPVWLEPNQVRFDLIGSPASLKSGMMFYYPDSLGIVGVIVDVNQNHSRAFITYTAISIAQGWLSTFIRDTISSLDPTSESWHEAISKKGDTLIWNSLTLSQKNLKTADLVVVSENGRMFSDNALVFMLNTSNDESDRPSLRRLVFDLDYDLTFESRLKLMAITEQSNSDSVRLGEQVYGPFASGGMPVFYRKVYWLGYRLTTARPHQFYMDVTMAMAGNAYSHYADFSTWKVSNETQYWDARIDSVSMTPYRDADLQFFISSAWSVILAGDTIAESALTLASSSKRTVELPYFTQLDEVNIYSGIQRKGGLLSSLMPESISAPVRNLYRQSVNGTLENSAPVPQLSVKPLIGNTSTNFEFDASSSYDLEDLPGELQFRWDFDGDDHYDTEFNSSGVIFHRYTSPGFYQVVLEVKDLQGLTARISRNVTVELSQSAPTAFFSISPESGRTNNYFIFDASASYDLEDPLDLLKVRWDFDNDGIWETQFSANKFEVWSYPVAGTYIIKLEVKDTQGLTGSTTRMLVVSEANIKPTAFFTVNPKAGTTSTLFVFDASGSTDPEDPVEDLQVQWDFENDGVWDNDYRQEKTINRRFTTAGSYLVVVRVMDTEGFASTYSESIVVTDPNRAPEADFTINPSTGTTETLFTFDGRVSSDPEDDLTELMFRWDWDNDGRYDTEFSSDPIAQMRFSSAGSKLIKMQVMDSGGLSDTKVRLLVVN